MDSKGNISPDEGVHNLELRETMLIDKHGPTRYYETAGSCGVNKSDHMVGEMAVAGKNIQGIVPKVKRRS